MNESFKHPSQRDERVSRASSSVQTASFRNVNSRLYGNDTPSACSKGFLLGVPFSNVASPQELLPDAQLNSDSSSEKGRSISKVSQKNLKNKIEEMRSIQMQANIVN